MTYPHYFVHWVWGALNQPTQGSSIHRDTQNHNPRLVSQSPEMGSEMKPEIGCDSDFDYLCTRGNHMEAGMGFLHTPRRLLQIIVSAPVLLQSNMIQGVSFLSFPLSAPLRNRSQGLLVGPLHPTCGISNYCLLYGVTIAYLTLLIIICFIC